MLGGRGEVVERAWADSGGLGGFLGGRWDDVRAGWMREVMRDRACLMMSRWDDDRFCVDVGVGDDGEGCYWWIM